MKNIKTPSVSTQYCINRKSENIVEVTSLLKKPKPKVQLTEVIFRELEEW